MLSRSRFSGTERWMVMGMAEYKDITELKKQIADFKKAVHSPNGDYLTGYVCALSATEGIIAGLPDADVVEVVRCKDCKHYDNTEGIQWCHLNSKFGKFAMDWNSFPEDGFCSYGERKDNG